MGAEGPPQLAPLLGSISAMFTLFGNGLILRAFCKVQSLRSPANLLLVSLAVADLLFIVSFVLGILTYTHHEKTFGCYFHVIQAHFFFALNTTVLLHLAAISIERLVAIKFSLRYIELVTKRRVKIAIAVIWILGIVDNVIPIILKITYALSKTDDENSFEGLLLGSSPPDKNESYRVSRCIHNRSTNHGPRVSLGHKECFWVSFCILLLPYVITIVCHAWIFKLARQHYERVKVQLESFSPQISLQMKHAKTTAIVMGSFLLLFTPLLVLVFLKSLDVVSFLPVHVARVVSSQCAWLNPLIYAWRNKDFRKAFREILEPVYSGLCCCRSNAESHDIPRVQDEEQV